MTDWLAYRGTGKPDAATAEQVLPDPPPWRRFPGVPDGDTEDVPGAVSDLRSTTFRAGPDDVEMVNAALYLRRPLLVTGKPGTGKSSLAHSVARELGLGAVLQWPITSRSTLREGLYQYDAVARLHDAGLHQPSRPLDPAPEIPAPDVGRYLRLGPLGTALLPRHRPRVLVIDELDKSDIDLPNDLLNVFEEGWFEVPELARQRDQHPRIRVMTADGDCRVTVEDGIVRCGEFPLVIITSNGEREFPIAFLRRCLRLEMQEPDEAKLTAIVEAHLGPDTLVKSGWLIEQFLLRREEGELATDQLLNAVFLIQRGLAPDRGSREELAALLLPYLDATTPT